MNNVGHGTRVFTTPPPPPPPTTETPQSPPAMRGRLGDRGVPWGYGAGVQVPPPPTQRRTHSNPRRPCRVSWGRGASRGGMVRLCTAPAPNPTHVSCSLPPLTALKAPQDGLQGPSSPPPPTTLIFGGPSQFPSGCRTLREPRVRGPKAVRPHLPPTTFGAGTSKETKSKRSRDIILRPPQLLREVGPRTVTQVVVLWSPLNAGEKSSGQRRG